MRRDFYGTTPTKSSNKNPTPQKPPSSTHSTPALQKQLFSNEKRTIKQQEKDFLSSSFDSQLIIASPSDHRFRHFHYTTTSEDSELNHLLNDYDPFPSSSIKEKKSDTRERIGRSISPPPPPPPPAVSAIPSRASSPSVFSRVTDLDFNDLGEEPGEEIEDWKDSLALSSLLQAQKQQQQKLSLSHHQQQQQQQQQQQTKHGSSTSSHRKGSPAREQRPSKESNKSDFLLDDHERSQVQRRQQPQTEEREDSSPDKFTSQSFYRKMEQLKKTSASFGGNEKHFFPSSLSPKLSPTATAAAVSLFSASLSPNASFSSSVSPRYQDPSLLLKQFQRQQPQSSSDVLSPSSANKITFPHPASTTTTTTLTEEVRNEEDPFLKYGELLNDLPSSPQRGAFSSSVATSPTATAGEGENMDILGLKLLLKTALREKQTLLQEKHSLQEENKSLISENSVLFSQINLMNSFTYFGKKFQFLFVLTTLLQKKIIFSRNKRFLQWKNRFLVEARRQEAHSQITEKTVMIGKKIFIRLQKIYLYRKFNRWKTTIQKMNYQLSLQEITFSRYFLIPSRYRSVMNAWKKVFSSRKALRKVTFSCFSRHFVKKAFSRWKEALQKERLLELSCQLKKQRLCNLITNFQFLPRKSLQLAFQSWKYQTLDFRKSQVFRYRFLIFSLKRIICKQQINYFFQEWKRKELIQTPKREILFSRCLQLVNRFSKLVSCQSFQRWKEQCLLLKKKEESIRSMIIRKLLTKKKLAFRKWQSSIKQQMKLISFSKEKQFSFEKRLLKSVSSLSSLLIRRSLLQKGWNTWKDLILRATLIEKQEKQLSFLKNNLTTLTGHLQEKQNQTNLLQQEIVHSSSAYKQQLIITVVSRILRYQSLKQLSFLRNRFSLWKTITISQRNEENRLLMISSSRKEKLQLFLYSFLVRMASKHRCVAFQQWKSTVSFFSRLQENETSLQNGKRKKLFLFWRKLTTNRKVQRHVIARLLTFRKNQEILKGFQTWKDVVEKRTRKEKALYRCVSLWLRKNLSVVWKTWQSYLVESKTVALKEHYERKIENFLLEKYFFREWKVFKERKQRLRSLLTSVLLERRIQKAFIRWKSSIQQTKHLSSRCSSFASVLSSIFLARQSVLLSTKSAFYRWKTLFLSFHYTSLKSRLSSYHTKIIEINDKQTLVDSSVSSLKAFNEKLLAQKTLLLSFYCFKKSRFSSKFLLSSLFHSWKQYALKERAKKAFIRTKEMELTSKIFYFWFFSYRYARKRNNLYFSSLLFQQKTIQQRRIFYSLMKWKVRATNSFLSLSFSLLTPFFPMFHLASFFPRWLSSLFVDFSSFFSLP
jgi:hypothetical protein